MIKDVKPKISVIIRSYNSENYIQKALESVLKQTLPQEQFEILVLDDGSSDCTCINLKHLYGKEIKLFENQHLGAVAEINFGIKNASGQFVILLDSDDSMEPNCLEELLLGASDDVAFVYSDYFEIDPKGVKKVVEVKDNIFNTVAAGVLIKKQALLDIGPYDEKLIFPEYDVLIRLTESNYLGNYIRKPLYRYRRRYGSVSSDGNTEKIGKEQLYAKYGRQIPIRSYSLLES